MDRDSSLHLLSDSDPSSYTITTTSTTNTITSNSQSQNPFISQEEPLNFISPPSLARLSQFEVSTILEKDELSAEDNSNGNGYRNENEKENNNGNGNGKGKEAAEEGEDQLEEEEHTHRQEHQALNHPLITGNSIDHPEQESDSLTLRVHSDSFYTTQSLSTSDSPNDIPPDHLQPTPNEQWGGLNASLNQNKSASSSSSSSFSSYEKINDNDCISQTPEFIIRDPSASASPLQSPLQSPSQSPSAEQKQKNKNKNKGKSNQSLEIPDSTTYILPPNTERLEMRAFGDFAVKWNFKFPFPGFNGKFNIVGGVIPPNSRFTSTTSLDPISVSRKKSSFSTSFPLSHQQIKPSMTQHTELLHRKRPREISPFSDDTNQGMDSDSFENEDLPPTSRFPGKSSSQYGVPTPQSKETSKHPHKIQKQTESTTGISSGSPTPNRSRALRKDVDIAKSFSTLKHLKPQQVASSPIRVPPRSERLLNPYIPPEQKPLDLYVTDTSSSSSSSGGDRRYVSEPGVDEIMDFSVSPPPLLSPPNAQPIFSLSLPQQQIPPFIKILVDRLPFSHQWELYRLIESRNDLSWNMFTSDFLAMLPENPWNEISDLLECFSGIKGLKKSRVLDIETDSNPNHVLTYSCQVQFEKGVASFILNIPTYQNGNRLMRSLEHPENVIYIDLPPASSVPLRRLITELKDVEIFGITYSFLPSKNPLHGLLVSVDHTPYSSLSSLLFDHLLPTQGNTHMPVKKFLARVDLLLSSSFNGGKLSHVSIIDDIRNDQGDIMTDGSGLISQSILKSIAKKVEWNRIPSAIQARYQGIKGLFVKNPENGQDSLLYRPSQLKYNILNPNSNQYDLDVVQLSRALPGFLNNQLINVLANRGVPLHVFEDIRRDAIESIADVLWGDWENDSAHHIQDVESMRGILSSMMSDSNQNGITTNDIYDSVLQLLCAGFDPKTCAFLASRIDVLFKLETRRLQFKSRFPLPDSCRVWIIPDPCNVLEEGEVYLHLTQKPQNKRILGPVAIGRNPALLASDIQVVNAVWKDVLSSYEDVLICSTKGKKSLASQLSGGDMDGDEVLVMWDPRIIQYIQPEEVVPICDVSRHFTTDSRTVEDILERSTSGRYINSKQRLLDFMIDSFVSMDSDLGIYTNLHANLSDKTGLRDPDVIMLAYICSTLVDSRKTASILKQPSKQAHMRLFGDHKPNWLVAASTKIDFKTHSIHSSQNEIVQSTPTKSHQQQESSTGIETDSVLSRLFSSFDNVLEDVRKSYRVPNLNTDFKDIYDKDLVEPFSSLALSLSPTSIEFNQLRQLQDDIMILLKEFNRNLSSYLQFSKTHPSANSNQKSIMKFKLIQESKEKYSNILIPPNLASKVSNLPKLKASIAYTVSLPKNPVEEELGNGNIRNEGKRSSSSSNMMYVNQHHHQFTRSKPHVWPFQIPLIRNVLCEIKIDAVTKRDIRSHPMYYK